MTLLLASCSGAGDAATPAGEPAPASTASAAPPSSASEAVGVPIRITFGSTTYDARLNDTSAARALADRLPLTLPFQDLMSLEKISPLSQPLPTDDVPDGDDPVPGDIGYWVPEGNLVLYYGDVGYWNGIVRIGSFDGDRALLEEQPDGFEVTIERVG